MKANIHNVRLSFATNSSSSHSIIIIPEDMTLYDSNAHYEEDSYGWEDFTLSSEKTKRQYLISQVGYSLENSVGAVAAQKLLLEWFGVNYELRDAWYEGGDKELVMPGIDHQSVIGMPKNLEEEYAVAFVEGLSKNPRVAILGGNDNSDGDSLPDGARVLEVIDQFRDRSGSSINVRQDGEYFSIYSKITGNKTRFSFNTVQMDNPAEAYTKASRPELVDVKITNYCPFGCSFCYQESTKDGLHASLEDVDTLFKQLGEMGVFEVAIGGGEPTMHPQFAEILGLATAYNITPNFTTFSTAWLKDEKIVEAVQNHVGGVGVSVHSEKDMTRAKKIREALGYKTTVMSQHVVGASTSEECARVIALSAEERIPLLLLGYKDVGFGTSFEKYDNDEFMTVLKMIVDTKKWFSLSVDTAILQQFPDLTTLLNVDPVLYTSEEGAFSCYVDLVDKKYAASSYCDKDDYIDLPETTEGLISEFAKW